MMRRVNVLARAAPIVCSSSATTPGMKIYASPQTMPSCEGYNSISDIFLESAENNAAKVAFVCSHTARTLTYGEVIKLVHRFAGILYFNHNIRPRDVVAVFLPNCLEYGSVFHGIVRLGAIASTMNPSFTAEEIRKQILLSKAKTVVTSSQFAKTVEEGVQGLGVTIQTIDGDLPVTAAATEVRGSMDDVVALPFSSGTTGLPKGVQLTNKNLVSNVLQSNCRLKFQASDVFMAVLPYFHIYALTVLLHGCMQPGGSQVVMSKFDMIEYLRSVDKYKCTHLFVAPPLMVGFTKHPLTKKTDLSHVKLVFSGAAPLTEEVQKLSEPLFPNAKIMQGYGLTETSPVLNCMSPEGDNLYGSVGPLVAGTEARIVKVGTREDVGPDEEGELWVRGPQVMKGYLKDEDTAKVFPEPGWFATGDLVRVDKDENFYITDRLKELIKVKGFQVAPAELEGLLLLHPNIDDAIVVGIPDDDAGELPRAQVVAKPGTTLDPDEVKEYVAKHTVYYKHLKGGVEVVPSIPKTPSGKLLRRVVRDAAIKAAHTLSAP